MVYRHRRVAFPGPEVTLIRKSLVGAVDLEAPDRQTGQLGQGSDTPWERRQLVTLAGYPIQGVS